MISSDILFSYHWRQNCKPAPALARRSQSISHTMFYDKFPQNLLTPATATATMSRLLLDTLIEKTVVPSFTSIGSRVRRSLFSWPALESYQLQSKIVVLTGGTSGIGKAGAELYAKLGATLVIVGRNPVKTKDTVEWLKQSSGNQSIHCVIGDLGSRDDVVKIAQELASRFTSVDVLVHNAGALFNTRQRANNGCDLSVELMVATPFLLTGLLLPQLLRAENNSGPARVLTMSSGGMYTEALTVDELQMSDTSYQGAKQYARAKRAQVILNELWAARTNQTDIVFHALHPGWVNTPGITEALPGFSKLLNPLGLLRTPREGADTMVWLSADDRAANCSGAFWHDRAIRPIDMSSTTRNSDTAELRKDLWHWCEQHTDWQMP